MAPKKYTDVLKKQEAVAAAIKDQVFIDAIEKPGDEIRFMSSEELAKFMEYERRVASNLFKELLKEKK
jgi:ribosomal protein S25